MGKIQNKKPNQPTKESKSAEAEAREFQTLE
jgi:hypothetical protein